MINSYSSAVLEISRLLRNTVTPEKISLVCEAVASQLDIPWAKKEIVKDLGTDRLLLSAILRNKKLLKWIIQNFIYGFWLLIKMILAIPKKPNTHEGLCLIYSLTPSQSSQGLESLREFLLDPRLGLEITRKTRIIIEQPGRSKRLPNDERNSICVGNISQFYFQEYLSFIEQKRLLFVFITRATRLLFTGKLIELLFFRQTIIEAEVYKSIVNNASDLNLITTQSHLRKLPTCFYHQDSPNVKRTMIWYSNNSFVIEKFGESGEFDSTRYFRSHIDLHLVWGEEWKNEIEQINSQSNVRAVGSLLWYQNQFPRQEEFSKKVVVFDVIPFSNFKYYEFYSFRLVSTFLKDILEILKNIQAESYMSNEVEVVLKQKREFQKNADKSYIDLLKTLNKEHDLTIAAADEDLYKIIASSKVVIGIPFVSPVFVAKEMGIPCCYYLSENNLEWIIPDQLDGVEVIIGKDELARWLNNALSKPR